MRAAWQVLVASVIADSIPPEAPRPVRRAARGLHAAFGMAEAKDGRFKRAVLGLVRPFAGTKLKVSVGPVNIEGQPPDRNSSPGRATIDVDRFIQEADRVFGEAGRRVAVMLDRIDEAFKYDRPQQEASVQALLQAEARLSLCQNVGVVVFLRTDLFELYDIQEKTKLVSRSVWLKWSEDDWLNLLVNRLLANPPLHLLAEILHGPDGTLDIRGALQALFPADVENQPVEQWLLDGVRNGNGDVSPRLAVMLLHLSRDSSPEDQKTVETLPLFSADALGQAMTKLSKLSFDEVRNDFKVAPSFVQNCRAGKRETFALADVEDLLAPTEGSVAEQVALLERLGFLERIVVDDAGSAKSLFRIPQLYTRFWSR